MVWLVDEFLPREMPPTRLLRLLHSLAIKRAHEIEGKAPVPSDRPTGVKRERG